MTRPRIHAVVAGLIVLLPALPACRSAEPVSALPAPIRLLIVAPDAFHPALAEFVAFKKLRLPTEWASLEEILRGSPGADDPERLKRRLYKIWRERRVEYVLLVGDADVLPVRFMVLDRVTAPAFDYAFYPSDLYYGDLARADGTFDDWNAGRESFHAGYYGEVHGEKNKKDPINYDRIDYKPDIAVGRWPVSTPEEAKIVADKTLAYEKGLSDPAAAGRRRAALFASGGWVDCRERMDAMARRIPSGWSVEKRYFEDEGRKDGTPRPDEAQMLGLLNEGVGMVCHTGHGSGGAWERCLSLGTLDRIRNADRLPVMMSAGCGTALFAALPPYDPYVDVEGKEHPGTNDNREAFTSPPPPPAPYQKGKYNLTGLGEQLVRRGPDGAVAYIGCNTGSQPCGVTLLEGFVDALAALPEPRLGDCWARAVSAYYDREHLADLKPTEDWYPPSIFFQGMKFMLFGDPSMPLPAPGKPAPKE